MSGRPKLGVVLCNELCSTSGTTSVDTESVSTPIGFWRNGFFCHSMDESCGLLDELLSGKSLSGVTRILDFGSR
ncbi:MAG: hypothetical protein GY820_17745 [Gammaproteobacteria bacterium]|nr:hypothetical protein [Gammaproteobacteria bacterium]